MTRLKYMIERTMPCFPLLHGFTTRLRNQFSTLLNSFSSSSSGLVFILYCGHHSSYNSQNLFCFVTSVIVFNLFPTINGCFQCYIFAHNPFVKESFGVFIQKLSILLVGIYCHIESPSGVNNSLHPKAHYFLFLFFYRIVEYCRPMWYNCVISDRSYPFSVQLARRGLFTTVNYQKHLLQG